MSDLLFQGGQKTIKWVWWFVGTELEDLNFPTGWTDTRDESLQNTMQQLNFPRCGRRPCLQVQKTLVIALKNYGEPWEPTLVQSFILVFG